MILDRDGVINQMVIHPDHGTIDSPLHSDQVALLPGVIEAIRQFNQLGFTVSIATNQPAAAKGKTTRANLEAVHAKILHLLQEGGAKIASSHICWHRAEDHCACRKPKPGLLEAALRMHGAVAADSWMVGDGVTDIEAGASLGMRTVFLGPSKCDLCKCLESRGLKPNFRLDSLPQFVQNLAAR
jgi:D-glycero-D-manno-heptose 1,7-bisphosphate phosphatase